MCIRDRTLYVQTGIGLLGVRSGKVSIIRPGDTIWIPPEEEHWHGATSENSMTHLAMQESLEGRTANWLEKVSEADYHK